MIRLYKIFKPIKMKETGNFKNERNRKFTVGNRQDGS